MKQILIFIALITCVVGCANSTKSTNQGNPYEESSAFPQSREDIQREKDGSVFDNFKDDKKSSSGYNIFGKNSNNEKNSKQAKDAPENAQALWDAALDAIDQKPIAVSDFKGGVISTDWYQDTKNNNERSKVNISITSSAIKSSSIKVQVFKQTLSPSTNQWVDVQEKQTKEADALKGKILKKALALHAQN